MICTSLVVIVLWYKYNPNKLINNDLISRSPLYKQRGTFQIFKTQKAAQEYSVIHWLTKSFAIDSFANKKKNTNANNA